MTDTTQIFEREVITLPPEDVAFLSGMAQAMTAMFCRLHPIPTALAPETKKEEPHNADQ